MYIRILNYLITKLENLRDKARSQPSRISAKEWARQHKEWREKNKSYK